MKRLLIILVLALAGCATTLIGKETQALESVTAARQVATASLRAGKITVAEDQVIQTRLNTVRAAIEAAVLANNPAAVDAAKADAVKVKADLEKK